MTDESGNVTERYAYDAYGVPTVFDGAGNELPGGSAENNRFMYTGREWDEDLSLYYYRARMYDPYSGRFCSRDPIGYEGSPWNLYEYVFGSPVKWVDPSGLRTGAPPRPGPRPGPRPRPGGPRGPHHPGPGTPGGPPIAPLGPLPPGTPPTVSPMPGTPEYREWHRKLWEDYWREKEREAKENLQPFSPLFPPPPKNPNCPGQRDDCRLFKETPPSTPGGCYSCKFICQGPSYLHGFAHIERFSKLPCMRSPTMVVPGYFNEADCEDSDPDDPLPVEGIYPPDPLYPLR